MMDHTPTPWQLDLGLGAPEVVGDSRRIARVLYVGGSEDGEVDANARFIVTACNCHEELLDALAKALLELHGIALGLTLLDWNEYGSTVKGYWRNIALAKAKGE